MRVRRLGEGIGAQNDARRARAEHEDTSAPSVASRRCLAAANKMPWTPPIAMDAAFLKEQQDRAAARAARFAAESAKPAAAAKALAGVGRRQIDNKQGGGRREIFAAEAGGPHNGGRRTLKRLAETPWAGGSKDGYRRRPQQVRKQKSDHGERSQSSRRRPLKKPRSPSGRKSCTAANCGVFSPSCNCAA